MLRICLSALVFLCACDPNQQESGLPVKYISAEVDTPKWNVLEVQVVLENPSKQIDAERFAACNAAEIAQKDGFIWMVRLRGNLRITGTLQELTVRYTIHELTEPDDKDRISAALFKRLCELDEIPTNKDQLLETNEALDV